MLLPVLIFHFLFPVFFNNVHPHYSRMAQLCILDCAANAPPDNRVLTLSVWPGVRYQCSFLTRYILSNLEVRIITLSDSLFLTKCLLCSRGQTDFDDSVQKALKSQYEACMVIGIMHLGYIKKKKKCSIH